uniref:Zinc finger, CCHC-type n=1 Tax=Solanum lycopersicum TaxID=4081 RepID=A0A3Q7IVV7_SOLLC
MTVTVLQFNFERSLTLTKICEIGMDERRHVQITLSGSSESRAKGQGRRKFPTAHAIWVHLRGTYAGTSTTHLQQLTIKFDTYKKRHDQNIKQYFRMMSNMIPQLKSVGHVLSYEKKVQAVIRSLPNNWEHLKTNLTHNDSIKTFFDVALHVELEDEHLGATNARKAGKNGKDKETREGPSKKKKKPNSKKGKRVFQEERQEKNEVLQFSNVDAFRLSTDHVSHDREAFVEFRRVSSKSRWMYVGNNARLEVKAGNNLEYVKIVKSWLSKSIDMEVMGEAYYILGVKIQRYHSKKF